MSTLIRSVSQQTPSHVHRAAVRTLMRSFSIHPTFRISKVSRRFLCFSRAIVFLRPQYLVPTFRWDKTPRSTTEYTDECLRIVPALSQTISRYSSPIHAMENLLASALPVADAVSFEFDGINVTAQHVMAPLARSVHGLLYNRCCYIGLHGQCLWCACSAFTTSSSKAIAVVKFRRIDVFMRGHVSEKWDTNGWWPSAAATCCKTARQTTIVMAACPQLMRRAVKIVVPAWRRADTDSSSATSPYIHWKLHGR